MAILVELQQLSLPGMTSSAQLDGKRLSRISTSHNQAEILEKLLTTTLSGQDIPSQSLPLSN